MLPCVPIQTFTQRWQTCQILPPLPSCSILSIVFICFLLLFRLKQSRKDYYTASWMPFVYSFVFLIFFVKQGLKVWLNALKMITARELMSYTWALSLSQCPYTHSLTHSPTFHFHSASKLCSVAPLTSCHSCTVHIMGLLFSGNV